MKAILDDYNISAKDLVAASTEGLTFKMVSKAVKGRPLTRNVQQKICNALNAVTGNKFTIKELFDGRT